VLEAEADPRPYLDAWRASGGNEAEARVAFLSGSDGGLGFAALASRLATAGAARTDVWLACPEPGAIGAAAALAARLRSLLPG
jgi:hypothetical protein